MGFCQVHNLEGRLLFQPLLFENVVDFFWGNFPLQGIGSGCNYLSHIGVHCLGQEDSVILLQNPSWTTLTTLAVDADNLFIFAANIMWINGNIRYIPNIILGHGGSCSHSLADGILMGARESGEYQFSCVGMARVDGHSSEFHVGFCYGANVWKIKSGIHALGKHVQGYGYNVQVSGTLAVTKQGAFHTVGSSLKGQLAAGNTFSSVVMIVKAHNDGVSVGNVGTKIFNLVCMLVAGGAFHRGGQVHDHLVFRSGAPFLFHCLTNLHGKLNFRVGKAFWGILESDVGSFSQGKTFFYAADSI